jgi:ABC-2 type transport system permease protein
MIASVKAPDNIISKLVPALWVELKKVQRSKTLWMTALAFSLLIIISGLFMYILKDPEQARNLVLLMVSLGGLIIFGFIFVWIFGREFGDKTVYDILSLPTPRVTVVIAKIITAAYWSLALILLVFVLMLGLGAMLQLPEWSAATVWNGLGLLLGTGSLTVLICIPFGLVASFTRGYLPAVGCIFLVIILGQVISQLGNGQYFPWTIPMLYSGAAEALIGKVTAPLGLISYILVGLVGAISLVFTCGWWRYADQT